MARSLGVTRRVTVGVCERIAAPVLVGILRPIILLPPAALTGWSPDEIEMVLLHELAHVRRWDNLINLVQRMIESLLFFHPAVWLVSGWVRREREACCDAVVVDRTNRPHAYAEMLVALAAQLSEPGRPRPRFGDRDRGRPGSLVASSAMAAGPLRSRIRRILQLEDDPMLVSGKSFAMVLGGLLVTATLAVLYLPTIGQAEESATEVTEVTELKGNQFKVENDRHATDDWPAGVAFPSPKEGEISRLAWQKLGLKIVSATKAEQAAANGHPLKVVGGTPNMPRLNGPVFLLSVGEFKTSDYDELAIALRKVEGQALVVVKCVVNTEHGPAWIDLARGSSDMPGKVLASSSVAPPPKGIAAENVGPPWPASENATHKFPSLEDQKLADLAWKRMQLELEPIGAEDLKRVQALGYEGGVKVAAGGAGVQGQLVRIQADDILVGLHAWPTTSMKDVAAVLNRDDLAELNPLKFYVVRQEMVGGTPENPIVGDVVHTGRVSASFGGGFGGRGRGYMRGEVAPTRPVPRTEDAADSAKPQAASVNPPNLRYDGRTFDEWRQDFLNRGPQETEALDALQAFAGAGYREEATNAILFGAFSRSGSTQQRTRKYLRSLPPAEAAAITARLIEVLESELAVYRRIGAIRAIAALGPNADSALEILKQRLASDNPQERIAAAAAIKMIVGKDQYQKPVADVLGKELGITVVESNGVWGALPREDVKDGGKAFNDFTEAVIKEQQQLFPDGKF